MTYVTKKLMALVLFLPCIQMNALKIDRVILSTDTNPDYIEFWPIVAKAWKEIVGVQPTLALVAPAGTPIDESLGDVMRFEPIEGIPTSLQAQVIRLLLPAYFKDDGCLISDIDMIPLNKKYFIDSAKNCADDCFIVYRDNAYHAHEQKFPMCYVAAKGKTFAEIFQTLPHVSPIETTIKQWFSSHLGWYTDELMLYQHLTTWQGYEKRCIKLGHWVEKRIDRSYWTYNPESLTQGYYIDAHCPRPYTRYKKEIDVIVELAFKQNSQKSRHKGPVSRFLENADYGTHMAPLITVVTNTDGPILEMGSGDFSTPLLHAICAKNKRFLLTTDTDKKWLHHFIDLQTEWHAFQYVPVYEDDWAINPKPALWDTIANNIHWSVILVDHRPGERRVEDIRRLRSHADIFVVHDTQQPSYGYEPVLSTFTYRYVYERYATQTTVVSDTIDISKFFEQ